MIRYELSPLSALAFRITDGSHNPPKAHSAGRLMLSAGCIQDGSINFNGRIVSQEDFEREHKRTQIKAGDVLLTIVGTVGRSAVVPLDAEPFIVQRSVAVIQPHSGIDPRFLSYQLRGPRVQGLLQSESRGVAQKGLYLGQLANIPVVLFPENEQRRIAEKLDELFSDLDAGVAALKRARANLKRYRAAVLKAAVEGKLTEQWRKEHPDVEPASKLLERILAERRKKWEEAQLAKYAAVAKTPPNGWKDKYPEPANPDTLFAPKLPAGWCWASLEQLSSAVRVICYGILMPKQNVSNGIPYVRVKDMKGDRIEIEGLHRTAPDIAAQYARASLADGDLLLAIRGTFGRVAEVPPELTGGNITQDTARIEVSPLMLSNYVEWALRSEDCQNFFKRVARGVAVKGVNIADVRRTPIPVAPLKEQVEIVNEVEQRLSVLETTADEISHALLRASHLRQAILERAFEGKLVPQDHSDEPASVLLERIRAAHAESDPPARNGRGKRTRAA